LSSQSTYPPEDDEDTIELELSAEEMRGLSRAARESQASTAKSAGRKPLRLWSVSLAIALAGAAAAIAWRPGPSHHIALRMAPTPAIASTPPAASQPAVLAQPQPPPEPQRPPVRMKNPFDAAEVFEFPAGTTRAEARRQVSAILLQRAVDRGSAGQRVEAADKHPANAN
jgi:hypothetical protein